MEFRWAYYDCLEFEVRPFSDALDYEKTEFECFLEEGYNRIQEN